MTGVQTCALPIYVVAKVGEALNSVGKPIKGSKILVLGLAYKADVDDDRESPSYILIEKLEAKGAKVDYHDPFVPVIRPSREHSHLSGRKSVPIDSSCDLVLISTAHGLFKSHNFSSLSVPLIDSRNCVSPANRPKLYFQA